MRRILIFIFAVTVIAGCAKMEEKKETEQNKTGTQQMQKDMTDPHSKMNTSGQQTSGIDSAALKISQDAFEFEKVYEKNRTDANKQELIKRHLAAGDAYSPNGDMQHMSRESFRTSLKHYRRVLELDTSNAAAKEGKELIEGMYQQIGLPIPE